MGMGNGKWMAYDDPKLEWPVQEHSKILMASRVKKDDVLNILSELKIQNEYAKFISAENRSLKWENEQLKEENNFLTNQLNKDDM